MRPILSAVAATVMMSGVAYGQTAETTTTETFVTVHPTDVLSYNLVGLAVTNSADEAIGEIKDLVISEGKLAGYVVSVGGFLGVNERYVMVTPAAVKITISKTRRNGPL